MSRERGRPGLPGVSWLSLSESWFAIIRETRFKARR
jgi:hypothetical protein